MQLPFNLNPYMQAYNPEAFVSSIIFSENEKYLPYLLSNYVQIIFYNQPPYTWLNYYGENWMLSKDGLIKQNTVNIPDFIMNKGEFDMAHIACKCLNEGYYVYGPYNEYHIPGKPAYLIEYYPNDYVLYGYDDETKEFLSAGFVNEIYTPFRIPFEAYKNALKIEGQQQDYIYYLSFNHRLNLTFDIIGLKKRLYDYLNSIDPENSNNSIGLEAIRHLSLYIKEKIELREEFELRPLYAVREHKQLMMKRLEYMTENGYISADKALLNNYKDVVEKADEAYRLGQKYSNEKESIQTNGICEKLNFIIEAETELLSKVYQKM